MLELVIKNDDFKVSILEKGKELRQLDASINIFNIKDVFFREFLKAFCKQKNFSQDYVNRFFAYSYGIPQRKINSLDSDNIITFDEKNYNVNGVPNEEKINNGLKEFTKYINKKDLITTYYCENEIYITIACVYHFLMLGYKLCICENCNNFFIAKTKSEKYCSRIIDKKDCKTIMKREKGRILENNEIYKLKKNTFYMLQKQIDRAILKDLKDKQDIAIKKQNELVELYPNWKKDLETKNKTMEEYKKWINGFYNKNGKHNT